MNLKNLLEEFEGYVSLASAEATISISIELPEEISDGSRVSFTDPDGDGHVEVTWSHEYTGVTLEVSDLISETSQSVCLDRQWFVRFCRAFIQSVEYEDHKYEEHRSLQRHQPEPVDA